MNKVVIAAIAMLMFQCSTQITGTSDETSTRSARVFNQDLTPAAGVKVKLFKSGDSSLVPDTTVFTDAQGRCSFHADKNRYYNIWAEDDSLSAFRDSVVGQSEGTDTLVLKKNGSVSGVIRMQPGDDPRTVYITVLGTYKYCNVNDEGGFTLAGLAQGDYTLRLVSTLADYTPTFEEISCISDSAVVLSDTLEMVYSGIPAVRNITARFDSVTGAAMVSWKKSTYPMWDRYIIYRRSSDAPYIEKMHVGTTTDTFFIDSTASGMSEITSRVRYSVSILSLSGEQGRAFISADVNITDPKLLLNQHAPLNGTSVQREGPVHFSWATVAGAEEYQLLLTGDYLFTDTLALISTEDTVASVPSLSDGAYHWKIRALGENGGYGPWSEAWVFGRGVLTMKFGEPGQYTGKAVMSGVQDGAVVLSSANYQNDASVMMVDTTGQVVWNAAVRHAGGCPLTAHRILKVDDGILGLLHSVGCEENDSSVIVKMDYFGNEIWRANMQYVSDMQISPENDAVFVVGKEEIVKLDQSGDLIATYPLASDSVGTAVPLNDSTLILGMNLMNSLQINQLSLGKEMTELGNHVSWGQTSPFAGWYQDDGTAVFLYSVFPITGSFRLVKTVANGAVSEIGTGEGSPYDWDKSSSTTAVLTVFFDPNKSYKGRNILYLFDENFSSTQIQLGECTQKMGENEFYFRAKSCAVQGESYLMILMDISEETASEPQTFLMRFPIGSRPLLPFHFVSE